MNRKADSFDWCDATIGRLRQLWGEGHATAEIGRRLGVSKNAVVGKAHRLELPSRPSPIRRGRPAGAPRCPSVPKLADMTSPRPPAVAAAAEVVCSPPAPLLPPVTPVETQRRAVPTREARQCCWPIGEPGTAGFRFCDQPTLGRKPYCAEHTGKAYVPRDRKTMAEAPTA